ncbi:hypothetical protein FKM82_025320 [Ascaphus truei]
MKTNVARRSQLYCRWIFSTNCPSLVWVGPVLVVVWYISALSLKAKAAAPTVMRGTFQCWVNRATGAAEYMHPGPRNASGR